MNKKLISVAVTGALVAPGVMAEEHTRVVAYGRISNALEYRDVDGGEAEWDMANVSSRIGFKASADLGNGLTAHGHYEFQTFTVTKGTGIKDTRIGTVGLSGAWGGVDVGNQWSAFYNAVGDEIDPTFSLGYYLYSSLAGGPYRSSNTIKYANTFGPVFLELDVRPAHEDADANTERQLGGEGGKDFLDGYGTGLRWAVTDALTLAAAYDLQEEGTSTPNVNTGNTTRYGVSGRWNFGVIGVVLGWHKREIEVNGVPGTADTEHFQGRLHGTVGERGSWMLGYGQVEYGGNDPDTTKPTAINMSYYHNVGGGYRLFYEGVFLDADLPGGAPPPFSDLSQHLFGMRFDF